MAKSKKVSDLVPASSLAPIYQFKITLKGVKPAITRTILFPSELDFDALHTAIQIAMGWENAHAYLFGNPKTGYSVAMDEDFAFSDDEKIATETPITDFYKEPKQELIYTYDMGDNWEHSIKLEKILESEPNAFYPICTKGENACPPEDCGGVWGYEGLLETIKDPKHPECEDMREWMGLEEGEEYDTTHFNIEEVNAFFQQVFKPAKAKKAKSKKEKAPEKPLLINLSNHPAAQWSEEQTQAALVHHKSIVDMPFPNVPPTASIEEVADLADEYMEKIEKLSKKNQPVAVHLMGEMTFTHYLVSSLHANHIHCFASTSERVVVDNGDGQKTVTFRFVQFRPYFNPMQGDDAVNMMEMLQQMMGGGDNLLNLMKG